jgi:hypothetical protein
MASNQANYQISPAQLGKNAPRMHLTFLLGFPISGIAIHEYPTKQTGTKARLGNLQAALVHKGHAQPHVRLQKNLPKNHPFGNGL